MDRSTRGGELSQISIFDWLSNNLTLSVLLLFLILVFIELMYFKFFVKIIRQGIDFRHYRRNRLFREGRGGGLVIMIPFIDRLETAGGILRPIDRQYVNSFIITVPLSLRYLHLRRGIPIKEYHEGERIFRIPFFDWIEIIGQEE